MTHLAVIDVCAGPHPAGDVTWFRCRDKYSISDKRKCLRIASGQSRTFSFDLTDVPPVGTAEVCLSGSLDIFDSHAYVHKFLNSLVSVQVNGTTVFDGLIHWRSHEETAAYWPIFNFPFDSKGLRAGRNEVVFTNRTTRAALGEFFDPQILKEFDEATAERKLTTLYLSTLEVNFVRPPKRFPRLSGVPTTAIAGQPFIVEVSTGTEQRPVDVSSALNAAVRPLGAEFEFGEWRCLFEVLPDRAGAACVFAFTSAGTAVEAVTPLVYTERGPREELIVGPAETTYWHQLKIAAQDFFELESGNCLRMSIDDFLNNLHHIPIEKWIPLIKYLVRRRRYYALQRLRVPHYTRIEHGQLKELADLGGPLFAGVAIPEPHHSLFRVTGNEPDLARRLAAYLKFFKEQVDTLRLPGHRIVTFDVAGSLSWHYYNLGLDVHMSEIGPSCNVVQEVCNRGAARCWGKPWGMATAMHWYCGQGAKYAYDESRVRYAKLTMLQSYLAGARQILWEGGVFDNLPVYDFILSEESWRDFCRRYDHPALVAVRRSFRELLDFHRAQQLPQPRARFGLVRGLNDTSQGFDTDTSWFGDLSMGRAWTLMKIFLPHVNLGRLQDAGRRIRRWYSGTPYGQVDVVPAEATAQHLSQYRLLAFTGWNTMSDDLYRKLVEYVKGGGTLFISTPHFTTDTIQKLEWSFVNSGDLTELCGVRVNDLGGRIEEVALLTDQFARHVPAHVVLSPRNPLFIENFNETYTVFERDVTYFGGELEVRDAEVLAVSQRGEPVVLRRRLGKGCVYLFNSYSHPGRGNFLPLAEGILRTLVEETETPLRMDNPSEVVSWFEYPDVDFNRYVFINTDWTREEATASPSVSIGKDIIRLKLPPVRPAQIVSDGALHLILEDPASQVAAWKKTRDGREVTVIGSDASSLRVAGDARGLRINGQAVP